MILTVIAILLGASTPSETPVAKPARICRESEVQLGSHMRSGRRCMTQEEWQQEDARRDRIPVTLRITGDPDDAQRDASRPH